MVTLPSTWNFIWHLRRWGFCLSMNFSCLFLRTNRIIRKWHWAFINWLLSPLLFSNAFMVALTIQVCFITDRQMKTLSLVTYRRNCEVIIFIEWHSLDLSEARTFARIERILIFFLVILEVSSFEPGWRIRKYILLLLTLWQFLTVRSYRWHRHNLKTDICT